MVCTRGHYPVPAAGSWEIDFLGRHLALVVVGRGTGSNAGGAILAIWLLFLF